MTVRGKITLSPTGRGCERSERVRGILGPQHRLKPLQYAFCIAEHVVIPKTENAIAKSLQSCRTHRVANIVSMLTAVDFHDELRFKADKIDDKTINWPLAAELRTKLTTANTIPEAFFGFRRSAPHLARGSNPVAFQLPLTLPSPRRGEGSQRV